MNRVSLIAVLGLFAAAGSASAHHSYGMFDRNTQKTITGTIQEFRWENPHSHIQMIGSPGTGPAMTWGIEMGPPAQLARDGWKINSLKPGDKVTALIAPLRDGSPGGHLLTLTKADGTVLEEKNKTLRGQGGDKLAAPRPGT